MRRQALEQPLACGQQRLHLAELCKVMIINKQESQIVSAANRHNRMLQSARELPVQVNAR